MIKKKGVILLAFILVLTILPILSALDPVKVPIFKKNSDIVLSIPCSFNKTQCSNSAVCNFTLFRVAENHTKLFNSSVTVDINSFFQINMTKGNFTIEGDYTLNLFCFDQDTRDSISKDFIVNNSGKTLSTAQGIIYVIVIIMSVLLFIAVFMGSFFIPSGNNRNEEGKVISINDLKYLKMITFSFSYLLLMWIMFMLMELSSNFMVSDTASRIFGLGFNLLFYSLWPLMLLSVLFFVMLKFQDKKFTSMLERGIFVDKV